MKLEPFTKDKYALKYDTLQLLEAFVSGCTYTHSQLCEIYC